MQFLLALGVILACLPQDSKPETRPDDPAEALLTKIDGRLYLAEQRGLKSVAFTYNVPMTGVMTNLGSVRIRVSWRAGEKPAVGFVDEKDAPIGEDKLPEFLRKPASREGQRTLRQEYELGAIGLLDLFRGQPYGVQFRKWRKTVETREVNGRQDQMLVFEPVASDFFRRVEMMLDRRSLPWKITTFLRDRPGASIVNEPVFEEFDGQLVQTSFKKTVGGSVEQFVIHYQRIEGIVVPASYERMERQPEETTTKIVFENVKVNG